MNDYQFGNFLRELRKKRGLSQSQLGHMIGVSNKAVSKWETGAAKPQTGICFHLAAALNVTVDELLACRFQEAEMAQKGNFAMHQKLWNKARTQMYKIYGDHPPVEVLGRFESEAAAFEGTDAIVYLNFLGELQQKAREQQSILNIDGVWGSSFVAWLMGEPAVIRYRPTTTAQTAISSNFVKMSGMDGTSPARNVPVDTPCVEKVIRSP